MKKAEPHAPLSSIHALIAEDDALIALDMEQTLVAHFGLRVSVVHSLRDGLDLVARNPPHIAVLDFDLDGSCIEPLACALSQAGAPIIFVSGYKSHPLERLAQGLKLDKPFAAEDLAAMVERALARLAA